MDYFPIFLKLAGQPVLVVGAGDIALRKVGLLLRAGAQLSLVAPDVCQPLMQMAEQKKLACHVRDFAESDLDGMTMVIAATNNATVNAEVSRLAQQRNLLVNVVDSPELCNFVMPAIIDRSPLVVAVSSGGNAPVLARLLRTRLEALIPVHYGRLAQLATTFRSAVKTKISTMAGRRRFWEDVFEGQIGGNVLAGADMKEAEARMQALLAAADSEYGIVPQLTVIGVASADADMLSIKATRLMQKADIVFADSSIAAGVLERCRRDADLQRIDKMDVDSWASLALQGKKVIYLTQADVVRMEAAGLFANVASSLDVQLIPAAPIVGQAGSSLDEQGNAGWEQIMRFDP